MLSHALVWISAQRILHYTRNLSGYYYMYIILFISNVINQCISQITADIRLNFLFC